MNKTSPFDNVEFFFSISSNIWHFLHYNQSHAFVFRSYRSKLILRPAAVPKSGGKENESTTESGENEEENKREEENMKNINK